MVFQRAKRARRITGFEKVQKLFWIGMEALISFPPQLKSLKGLTGYPSAAHGVQSHCGARNSTPPSLTTRRISRNAASGLGTCSKTHIVHAASNSFSPNG